MALNRGPLLTSGVEAPALYPHQVQLKREEGALLIDVRTDLQFDDVHIHGSICIPSFTSGFGSKLAWLADHDREVVFIGRDDEDGRRAARLALAVGVRNIAGFLSGGMTNWRQERQPADHTDRVAAEDLRGWLAKEPDLQLLDVRERHEWDTGTRAGVAVHPVARHRRASPRASTQPADRGDLRGRHARRHRREPAQAPRRAGRDPRRRRRRAGARRRRRAADAERSRRRDGSRVK